MSFKVTHPLFLDRFKVQSYLPEMQVVRVVGGHLVAAMVMDCFFWTYFSR